MPASKPSKTKKRKTPSETVKSGKHRGWMFTLFNYSDEDEDHLQEIFTDPDNNITGAIYQHEICPSTAKPHLQGYFRFKNPRVFSGVIAMLAPVCHPPTHPNLTFADRTPRAAWNYCMKSKSRDEAYPSPWMCGDAPSQGKRNDFEDAKEIVLKFFKEHGRYPSEEDLLMKYSRGMPMYKAMCTMVRVMEKPRDDVICNVYWFYGPTGTGKSYHAKLKANKFAKQLGFRVFYQDCGLGKWWQGYDGEKIIILDEFRPDLSNNGYWKLSTMLNVVGGAPLTVQRKNDSRQLQGEIFFITSDQSSVASFGNMQGSVDQLTRRIELEVKFPDPRFPLPVDDNRKRHNISLFD